MPKTKVYSTVTCPYCVTLKEFLASHDIEFEAVDVTSDHDAQKEMIEKSGQMGVPVTTIDDNVIIGFDREKISELLNIKE